MHHPTIDLEKFAHSQSDRSINPFALYNVFHKTKEGSISQSLSQPLLNGRKKQNGVSMRRSHETSVYQWSPLASEASVGNGFDSNKMMYKTRPKSAPDVKLKRSNSHASSIGDSIYSLGLCSTNGLKSRGKNKSRSYMQIDVPLCVHAFQNGSLTNHARVNAYTINQLLDKCTEKLGLVSAARILYLSTGVQVTNPHQLMKDGRIYVSCGESFIDPNDIMRGREHVRNSTSWTLNGIILQRGDSNVARLRAQPSSISMRMEQLVVNQKQRRILVFKNGWSSGGVEVLTQGMQEFLDECSKKLNMSGVAKVAYSIKGKQILDLDDVEELEECFQSDLSHVFGPLWITKGERFSPKGSYDYIAGLLIAAKQRLKIMEMALKESVVVADYDDDENGNNIEAATDHVLEDKLAIIEDSIVKLTALLDLLKRQCNKEEQIGRSYKFQHITAIESNSRLVGEPGIHIKIHESGDKHDRSIALLLNTRDISKGCKSTSEIHQRFLDTVNENQGVIEAFFGGAKRGNYRRSFLRNGLELHGIESLTNETEVWLSKGEDFVPFENSVIGVSFSTVKITGDHERLILVKSHDYNNDGSIPKLNDWCVVNNVLNECSRIDAAANTDAILSNGSGFIMNKDDESLYVKPSLSSMVFNERERMNNTILSSFEWTISDDGTISNNSLPQFYLTIEETFKVKSEKFGDGYCVYLDARSNFAEEQKWCFSSNGYIYSSKYPQYHLTFLQDNKLTPIHDEPNDERTVLTHTTVEKNVKNEDTNLIIDDEHENDFKNYQSKDNQKSYSLRETKAYGNISMLGAFLMFKDKSELIQLQRWAIKTRKSNQYTPVEQYKGTWIVQKLNWPINKDGVFIQSSLSGMLLPCAPKLKRKSNVKTPKRSVGQPMRLLVKKNGAGESQKVFNVVGPDLTHMTRNLHISLEKLNRRSKISESDSASIADIEMLLFLERCTEQLKLSTAARRLFDENGKEIINLSSVSRDQTVYVSCGGGWIDPGLSHYEQQQRQLLAGLASDIKKLEYYISLRDSTGLIISIDGPLKEGTNLKAIPRPPDKEGISLTVDNNPDEHNLYKSCNDVEELKNELSNHEKSHKQADEKLKLKLKPWQQECSADNDITIDSNVTLMLADDNQFEYSNPQMSNVFGSPPSFKPKQQKSSNNNNSLSYWLRSGDYIMCKINPQFVIAMATPGKDSHSREVQIQKRDPDNPCQRWLITSEGVIHSKSNPSLALTVAPQRLPTDPFSSLPCSGYTNGIVLVAPVKETGNGKANQTFSFETDTGYLEAISSDFTDRELTAANKSNICTSLVSGNQQMDQLGYSFQKKECSSVLLCESCGVSYRAKYNVERLMYSQRFCCSSATSSGLDDVTQGGPSSFKCIPNKINLQKDEADLAVKVWKNQLQRLRSKSNIRSVATELHATRSVPAVRLCVHRNGLVQTVNDGVVITGNTISQVLDICTYKLDLSQAARRLYLADGKQITTFDQLLAIYYPEKRFIEKDQSKSLSTLQVPLQTEQDALMVSSNRLFHDQFSTYHVLLSERDIVRHNNKEVLNEEKESLPHTNDMELDDKKVTRVPVDVWVSCGERFMPLADADKKRIENHQKHQEYAVLELYLEEKKHLLRQLQGRRQQALSPQNQQIKPVMTEKWAQSDSDEKQLQELINELKNHLNEVKYAQNNNTRNQSAVKSTSQYKLKTKESKVYNLPQAIKLNVYHHRESQERAVTVFASDMKELLDYSSARLDLDRPAKHIFDTDGIEVKNFNDLKRNQIICVTCHGTLPKQKGQLSKEQQLWLNGGQNTRKRSKQKL